MKQSEVTNSYCENKQGFGVVTNAPFYNALVRV